MIINTQSINILSNFIYLLCGLYLISQKMYLYGIIAIIVWFISHMYHLDRDDCFWRKSDMIVASICFVFVLIICKDILCKKYIIYFIIILSLLFTGMYFCHKKQYEKYDIIHSIWHILSGLVMTNLIITSQS